MVEEGARGDIAEDFIADTADIKLVERLDRAGRLAMRRAKRSEVMKPDQGLRGLVHCLCIKRARYAPC